MHRSNRLGLGVVTLAVSAGLGAGCSSDTDGSSGSSDVAVDLRFGTVAALTGEAAQVGQAFAEAAGLAVDEIDRVLDERGDDSNVEIVGSEDSAGQSSGAISGARKLVDIDGANIIVGDITSTNTIAIAQSVTVAKQVLQLAHGTSSAITELDDNGLVFRAIASDAVQGPALAQLAEEELGPDAEVNVAYSETAWGEGVRDEFRSNWEAAGGAIGNEVALGAKVASYETEAQELVQGDPDGWVMAAYCTEWGRLRGPLLRSKAWDPRRTLVADAAAYCVPPDTLESGMGGTKSSVTGEAYPAFESLYERQASDRAALQEEAGCAFDLVVLAFLAAKAAGSDDPVDISVEMEQVSAPPGRKFTYEELPQALDAIAAGEDIDYEGVSGGIDFDENGDITSESFDRWRANPKGGFETVAPFKTAGQSG